MKKYYYQLFAKARQLSSIANRPLIIATNNRPWLFSIYKNTVLQLRVVLFIVFGGLKGQDYTRNIGRQLGDARQILNDDARFRQLRWDMICCWVLYGIDPKEYLLFDFEHQKHDERRQWLSDRERFLGCVNKVGYKSFDILQNKMRFYQIAKKYYHRDVCEYQVGKNKEEAAQFVASHPRFIAKPIAASLGIGIQILDLKDFDSVDTMLEQLQNGTWILEEIVEQDERMAAWNSSSLNTIRVPSFIDKDRNVTILNPTIRIGRAGSVVDNAGAGGVTASINVESGKIECDGIDKSCQRYVCHPDSKRPFKGTQIPMWDELKAIVAEVHKTLPPTLCYVGFDFALSTHGWVLIEGNWGQLQGSQTSSMKGIRYQFEEFMGLSHDFYI